MEDEYYSVRASPRLNHAAYTVFFQFIFFPPVLLTSKRAAEESCPCLWWYFDFSFPFPVYHSLIRSPHAVTCSIQLHLLKCRRNAIINMKYCPDRLQLFQREKHWCLLFRNQVLAPGASHYLFSLGQTRKKSPKGMTNLPLVCTAPAIQKKTRLSQLLLIIWTTRWMMINAKEKYIYIAKSP